MAMTYSPTLTADGRKICAICKEAKPLDRFSTNGSSALADGMKVKRYRAYCLPCDAKRANEWRKKQGPEYRAKEGTKYHLKKYGLTPAQYEQMVMTQCGLCEICGELPVGYVHKLVVHHDHGADTIVALLCSACNIGLGKFKDDPVLLHRAAKLQEGVI